MIKRSRCVFLFLYLGLLCAAVACGANPPHGDPATDSEATITPEEIVADVRTAPAETTLYPVVTKDIQTGQTGIVEIRLDNVTDLYGLHIHATFDPDVLQVEDANPEKAGVQIVPAEIPAADFIAVNQVDNEEGVIEYAVTQTAPREPVAGSGAVAVIHFRGVAVGTSPLSIEQALLSDQDGQAIPLSVTDGKIEVE